MKSSCGACDARLLSPRKIHGGRVKAMLDTGLSFAIKMLLGRSFAFLETVCRKTLQEVNRDSEVLRCPKKFRKKLYVS
jgi:hypothetical protein